MKQYNNEAIKISAPGSYLLLGPAYKTEQHLQEIIKATGINWADIKLVKPEDSKGKTLITSIDQVREAQSFINLTPLGKIKMLVFTEAGSMPPPAANALLKTLEEPPKYGLVILQSTTDNLLPTIVSRCQKILLWDKENKKDKKWDFNSLLAEPFFKQSAVVAKVAENQQSLEFLNEYELWAREGLREKKDKRSSGLIREIINAKRDIKGNLSPRVVLETLILRYIHHV